MNPKLFTSEDIKFLKDNYLIKGVSFCAEKLKRSKPAIRSKAISLGMWSRAFKFKAFDKYLVNPKVFLDINTPEVAYILGLLWADGCVTGANLIKATFLISDAECLYSTFMATGKWGYWVNSQRNRKYGTFATTNFFISNFLIENDYKVKSWESAEKILSKIPEHLKHYWFRGVVDGDGCFYVKKNGKNPTFTLSSGFTQNWKYFEDLMHKLGIVYKINRQVRDVGRVSGALIYNKVGIRKFGEYIYQNYENDKIGLERKYDKWRGSIRYNERYLCKDFY